jgi:hypothetical protein
MGEPSLMSKLIARTLPLIVSFMMLSAAARADSWCTLWKNQQMCGSVEDFQNFARRICLQALAKENPTVEESMALHGDCQAATVMVSKAEAAKTAHERAAAAQKQLDGMQR